MARPRSEQPTDGELQILKVLWRRGPCSLGDVKGELQKDRPVATTTVATMLKVMLEKELVSREDGPRGYLWSARAKEETTARVMLRRFVDGVFDGSAERLVSQLLRERRLSREEIDQIARLIADHRPAEPSKPNKPGKPGKPGKRGRTRP